MSAVLELADLSLSSSTPVLRSGSVAPRGNSGYHVSLQREPVCTQILAWYSKKGPTHVPSYVYHH